MHRRILPSALALLVGTAFVVGCSTTNYTAPTAVAVPDVTNINYMLQLGSPAQPSGVLLSWTDAVDTVYSISDYVVYSRSGSGSWSEIGITTSNTFHDNGEASQWYLIVAEDLYGDQSPGDSIQVTTTATLPPPASLNGTAYDTAAALAWPNTPLGSGDAADFSYYRIYSDIITVSGSDTTCAMPLDSLEVEGSTVSSAFILTGLANGVPRCYAVSSVSASGQESALSPGVFLTPSSSDPVFAASAWPHAVVAAHRLALHAPVATRSATVAPRRL